MPDAPPSQPAPAPGDWRSYVRGVAALLVAEGVAQGKIAVQTADKKVDIPRGGRAAVQGLDDDITHRAPGDVDLRRTGQARAQQFQVAADIGPPEKAPDSLEKRLIRNRGDACHHGNRPGDRPMPLFDCNRLLVATWPYNRDGVLKSP